MSALTSFLRRFIKSRQKFYRSSTRKIRKFLGIHLYSDYVDEIHATWWNKKKQKSCINSLSDCIDRICKHDDSEDQWHCCPYWHRRLTNKLSARELAIKYGIPVPELYWYGKNVNDIPFEKLPSRYVIKTSFGTSAEQVIPIIDGRNMFTDKESSRKEIKQFFDKIMQKTAPYGYLMAEEFLTSESGDNISKDYKCHTFNGELAFIEVIDRTKGEEHWYTREWLELPEEMNASSKYKTTEAEPRPHHHQELIQYAEKLGRGYGREYVRIDFYMTCRGCVFGEFTATPGGGRGITDYANRTLGRLWADIKSSA